MLVAGVFQSYTQYSVRIRKSELLLNMFEGLVRVLHCYFTKIY